MTRLLPRRLLPPILAILLTCSGRGTAFAAWHVEDTTPSPGTVQGFAATANPYFSTTPNVLMAFAGKAGKPTRTTLDSLRELIGNLPANASVAIVAQSDHGKDLPTLMQRTATTRTSLIALGLAPGQITTTIDPTAPMDTADLTPPWVRVVLQPGPIAEPPGPSTFVSPAPLSTRVTGSVGSVAVRQAQPASNPAIGSAPAAAPANVLAGSDVRVEIANKLLSINANGKLDNKTAIELLHAFLQTQPSSTEGPATAAGATSSKPAPLPSYWRENTPDPQTQQTYTSAESSQVNSAEPPPALPSRPQPPRAPNPWPTTGSSDVLNSRATLAGTPPRTTTKVEQSAPGATPSPVAYAAQPSKAPTVADDANIDAMTTAMEALPSTSAPPKTAPSSQPKSIVTPAATALNLQAPTASPTPKASSAPPAKLANVAPHASPAIREGKPVTAPASARTPDSTAVATQSLNAGVASAVAASLRDADPAPKLEPSQAATPDTFDDDETNVSAPKATSAPQPKTPISRDEPPILTTAASPANPRIGLVSNAQDTKPPTSPTAFGHTDRFPPAPPQPIPTATGEPHLMAGANATPVAPESPHPALAPIATTSDSASSPTGTREERPAAATVAPPSAPSSELPAPKPAVATAPSGASSAGTHVQPAPTVAPVATQMWALNPAKTLKENLDDWAAEAGYHKPKWLASNYIAVSSARTFNGGFLDAIDAVRRGTSTLINIDVWPDSKDIKVTDK